MKKKLYLVTGIPSVMSEKSEEFRQDLKTYKWSEEEIAVRIPLTMFQALIARIQTLQYNLRHPYNKMEITRLKAKRYRV